MIIKLLRGKGHRENTLSVYGEGKREQESTVKIQNTGRSKCTLSVGVKELKSPFRKQKLPEGMGKKIKLCVDCIP